MGFLPIIGPLFAAGAGATGAAVTTGFMGSLMGTLGSVTAAAAPTFAGLGLATAAPAIGGLAALGTPLAAAAAGLGGGAVGWTLAAMPSVLTAAAPAAVAGATAAGSFWANAANMASVVGTGASLMQGMFSQQQQQEMPSELKLPEMAVLPEEPDAREAALQAAEQERQKLKRRVSFTNTLLTGPRGLLEAPPLGFRTLLGG